MAKTSELLLNVVTLSQPKMLLGWNQKVSSLAQVVIMHLSRTFVLPAKRESLSHSGGHTEQGKPTVFLSRKARCEACR